ncbi:MAG: hypothetical protein CL912_13135 [Deltaproteobacteria bacterium]|nr:hypothetical protein [Deltaproteobacteria bacterium]|tara:strand:+ start:217 stop:432 length:216 start_codon:yes stop_codon:yes gene_type:complete
MSSELFSPRYSSLNYKYTQFAKALEQAFGWWALALRIEQVAVGSINGQAMDTIHFKSTGLSSRFLDQSLVA